VLHRPDQDFASAAGEVSAATVVVDAVREGSGTAVVAAGVVGVVSEVLVQPAAISIRQARPVIIITNNFFINDLLSFFSSVS
jgi:hypothetical protein